MNSFLPVSVSLETIRNVYITGEYGNWLRLLSDLGAPYYEIKLSYKTDEKYMMNFSVDLAYRNYLQASAIANNDKINSFSYIYGGLNLYMLRF